MSNNEPSQLNTDLAALLGFSAGNRTAAAIAIKQALQGLGIDKHTKSLTADDKAAITQWHKARLNNDNQLDIETIAPPVVINEPIETAPIIEQVETIPGVVDTIADDTAITELETALQLINAPLTELELLRIENAKLQARLELIDSKTAPTYPDNQLVRLTIKGKQIALNGGYLNALMVSTGIDKANVKKWLESSVIDSKNVTESVKLLIVRNLESELIKARG